MKLPQTIRQLHYFSIKSQSNSVPQQFPPPSLPICIKPSCPKSHEGRFPTSINFHFISIFCLIIRQRVQRDPMVPHRHMRICFVRVNPICSMVKFNYPDCMNTEWHDTEQPKPKGKCLSFLPDHIIDIICRSKCRQRRRDCLQRAQLLQQLPHFLLRRRKDRRFRNHFMSFHRLSRSPIDTITRFIKTIRFPWPSTVGSAGFVRAESF